MPYELIIGRPPSISFMRPFGCPVTILNTFDPLGKFDGKAKEWILVGYSVNSKAFKTYIVFPLSSSISSSYKSSDDKVRDNTADDAGGKEKVQEPLIQEKVTRSSSTYSVTTVSTLVNTASASRTFIPPHDPLMPTLEDTAEIQKNSIFGNTYDEDGLETNNHSYADESVGAEADFNNKEPSTVMDVKSDFLYGTIKEEVYVYVADIIFGSTKKSLCDEFEQIMHNRFQISSIEELTFFLGLQVHIRSATTPMETHKPLTKDENVCACSRFQVQPKVSHLHAVKRIFRYLKGQPKLGLWYPKDSPLTLKAFSDSDYAGASLDRKSTTGGCQFFCLRLISWQCKKRIVVANSTTKAKYIVASHYCRQVLWIQNQMMDYEYNFMQTKIHVDNESAICVIKNPVYHSKIKHI
nr:hypothetical protein [Tanacetum cinerariifolium]